MSRIELPGMIDDQHRLNVVIPEQIKAGPVKVILEAVDKEDDLWFQGIATIWAREYDPREDVYTLQDGVPFDETE